MNRTEALEIMRTIGDMYPNAYRDIDNQDKANRQVNLMLHYLATFEYTDVINGLYAYYDSEKAKYTPSVRDLKEFARIAKRNRENKQGIGHRRIVTPEEDMANEYIEIMDRAKKRGTMTDEEDRKVHILLPYYEMFFGTHKDELYLKHFGKPRAEFERLD